MIKSDVVYYVSKHTSLTRLQAIEAVDGVIEAIRKSLVDGENVCIRGFASFRLVTRAPKKARDIYKGTAVYIPERRSVKLVLSKDLKAQLNKE